MILEIQHETRLEYTEPVSEWLAEVRMEPVSDERQTCHSFHLAVSQPTQVFRYLDGFGNRVHHFNLLAAAPAGARPGRQRRRDGPAAERPAGEPGRRLPLDLDAAGLGICRLPAASAARSARRRGSTRPGATLKPRPGQRLGDVALSGRRLHPSAASSTPAT